MGIQSLTGKSLRQDPTIGAKGFYSHTSTGTLTTSYSTLFSISGKAGKLLRCSFMIGVEYYLRITADGVVVFENRALANNASGITQATMTINASSNLGMYEIYPNSGTTISPVTLDNTRLFTLPYSQVATGSTFGYGYAPYGVQFKYSLLIEAKLQTGTGTGYVLYQGVSD